MKIKKKKKTIEAHHIVILLNYRKKKNHYLTYIIIIICFIESCLKRVEFGCPGRVLPWRRPSATLAAAAADEIGGFAHARALARISHVSPTYAYTHARTQANRMQTADVTDAMRHGR